LGAASIEHGRRYGRADSAHRERISLLGAVHRHGQGHAPQLRFKQLGSTPSAFITAFTIESDSISAMVGSR
jgi:hypothetical protein